MRRPTCCAGGCARRVSKRRCSAIPRGAVPGSRSSRGDHLYNNWQDATYPRGLLRRTTLDEYRKKDPKWEPVLDIGKLAADESQPWVYKGTDCLYPAYRRCLIYLSLVVPGPVLLAVAVAGPVVPGLVVLVPVAVSLSEAVTVAVPVVVWVALLEFEPASLSLAVWPAVPVGTPLLVGAVPPVSTVPPD